MFLTFILMFIPILLVSVGWNFVVENLYMPIIPQVSIKSQLFFILSNPLSFPYILINSLLHYGLSYQFLFVGNFWLDVPLPIWWLGIYLLGLIPVSLMDKSNIKIYSIQKIVSFITLILIFVAVCLFIYLSWTPVGQDTIEGIQGRYFIPIGPLLFLLLFNKRKSITIRNKRINLDVGEDLNLAIILYIIIFLSITLFIFIISYYI